MSRRNVLTVVSLILSVVIGLALARGGDHGRGTSSDGVHTITIGLSLDTLKEARWQRDRDSFKAKATALGARVLDESANSDDTQQMKDIQSLIADHVDVLVIVPHDGVAMGAAVAKAKAAGIPVIAYDRLIQNCDLDLYTSFDNVEVGRQQARFLVAALHGKGAIVRIYGSPADDNAHRFKAGQDEILKPYLDRGDITVVHQDWAEDWKPENAKRITEAAITKGAPFQAILASNDGTAGGAIQALTEARITGVIVTGQDAELPACQRIAAGTQTMTIYKPLRTLADGAAILAVELARHEVVIANGSVDNGRRQVPAVLYPTVTVTRSNLISTVIADGFLSYDEVYRGIPADRRPPRPVTAAPASSAASGAARTAP